MRTPEDERRDREEEAKFWREYIKRGNKGGRCLLAALALLLSLLLSVYVNLE